MLWSRLLSAHEAGFLCGASCGSAGGADAAALSAAAEAMGLLTEHAYSVLQVRVVEGTRLLQLRNPWGKLEWRRLYLRIRVCPQLVQNAEAASVAPSWLHQS